jgi:hypothetical protein
MPKSKHQVPGRVRSIYAFIKAHRDQYSVQTMCRILGVAVSGYYLWLQQPISNHDHGERMPRLKSERIHARVVAADRNELRDHPIAPGRSLFHEKRSIT